LITFVKKIHEKKFMGKNIHEKKHS